MKVLAAIFGNEEQGNLGKIQCTFDNISGGRTQLEHNEQKETRLRSMNRECMRTYCYCYAQYCTVEFVEEALEIVSECTLEGVSPAMWQAFSMMHVAFKRDAIDYFPGEEYLDR